MKREFVRVAGGLALAAALVSTIPCPALAVGNAANMQVGGGVLLK